MEPVPGWNSRLGPIEAAILEVKLRHLPAMIERRRQIAARYRAELAGLGLRLPGDREGAVHAYHLYVVACSGRDIRDGLRAHLAERGIMAGIHYEHPVHLQPAYRGRLVAKVLPVTESIAGRILSLPIYPELREDQQSLIIAAVRDSLGSP